ncbi:hypothetical protein RchiOBHm_Chr4g0395871 [Rosa chinensis]|uniref:Uncharacterized protein n=1 Tax=Rosa chinensis TaxID=74649 RepID=A0A2P6QRL8_ROSCH|nr:hypothetical protein RchiOBHm_Chr4g0395871 [Rosa chinensis]
MAKLDRLKRKDERQREIWCSYNKFMFVKSYRPSCAHTPSPGDSFFTSALIVSFISFLQVTPLRTSSSFSQLYSASHYSTSTFNPDRVLILLIICICSDSSFGYPGGPLLFKNLNFGIDLDSSIASNDASPFELLVFLFENIIISFEVLDDVMCNCKSPWNRYQY